MNTIGLNEDLDYIIMNVDISQHKLTLQNKKIDNQLERLENKKNNEKLLLKKIQILQLLGKIPDSNIYIDKILLQNPNMVQAIARLGNVYLYSNEYSNAKKLLDKANHIDKNYAYVYLLYGNLYRKIKKYDLSISHYSHAIKLNTTYTEAYCERVLVYKTLGDEKHAITDLKKIIDLKPYFDYPYNYLGFIYQKNNKHNLAIKIFSLSINLKNNKKSYPLAMRGYSYMMIGKYKNALADFTLSIQLNPSDKKAYLNRGVIYTHIGKIDLAIADYSQAVNIDKNYLEAYQNRATLFNVQQKYKLAVSDLTYALQIMPEMANIYFLRGKVYLDNNIFKKAIKDFTKTISLQEDSYDAYINRGICYGKMNNYDLAINDLTQAITIDKNKPEAYYYRAYVFSLKKKKEESINDYSKLIELSPKNPEAYYLRGCVFHEKKEYDMAIMDYKKAKEINSRDIRYHIGLGILMGDKKEYVESISCFTETISLFSDCIGVYYNRAVSYHMNGEYDKSIDDCNVVLNKEANNVLALFQRGYSFAKSKKYDDAIKDFSAVISINKYFFKAFLYRGITYKNINDYTNALKDFYTIPNDNEFSYESNMELGSIYCDNIKTYEKGIEYFNKAIIIKPDSALPYFYMGLTLGNMDNNKEAYEYFIKALEIDPHIPGCNYYIGISLLNIGDYKNAFKYIKIALKKEPEDDFLQNQLLRNQEIIWKLNIETLRLVNNYFFNIIADAKQKRIVSKKAKQLIQVVYNFWQNCRCNKNENGYIYQYMNIDTFRSLLDGRNLHLNPASYQNDPDEGSFVFSIMTEEIRNKHGYEYLVEELKNVRDSQINQWITFVRSFTCIEDSLIMWNSSYGDNGMGISLGLEKSKINKNSGMKKYEHDIQNNVKQIRNLQNNYIPLNKMGLYAVRYINRKGADDLDIIIDCLMKFKKKDFSDNLRNLLNDILLPIAPLIKDIKYSHENEYRLIYIGTIENDRKFISTKGTHGIYLETENILFDGNGREKVCFGPKVDNVTFLKLCHIMKYNNYNVEIKKSEVRFQ